MADENNPSITPSADKQSPNPSDTSGDGGGKAGDDENQGDDGSSEDAVSPAEAARRRAQSERDKERSNSRDEDIDFLLSREEERARDSYINGFLQDNSAKYPHVNAEDLKYAGSKEEVEELATHLENRYKELEQEALSNVSGDPEPKELSVKQAKEIEDKLEEEAQKTGKSSFGSFLDTARRIKRR